MAEQQLDMMPISDDASLIGKDLGAVPDSKWAPLLAQMVQVLEALYRRRGMGDEAAFKLASDSVLALAEYFGGRVVYLPRGDRLKTALRDAEIYRRFRGSENADALAVEYDLSVIRVYAINAEQRQLHLRKIQGRLFED